MVENGKAAAVGTVAHAEDDISHSVRAAPGRGRLDQDSRRGEEGFHRVVT